MEGAILAELQSVKQMTDDIREKPSQVVEKVLVGDSDKDNRTEELWQTLGVEEHSLSNVERAQLRQVVDDYDDVFALDDFELGATTACQHVIHRRYINVYHLHFGRRLTRCCRDVR